MAVEIALHTPLADALHTAIQPKLIEVGWAAADDESPLPEYILLMLVNGKTQDEIATELANDLLGLDPDDVGAKEFSRWLFDQIELFTSQFHGGATAVSGQAPYATDSSMDQDMETGSSTSAAELNAPTGPRSMRNGEARGGNRGRRILGQVNRAMDRSHDSVLHRVRGASGNERINSHNRQTPNGPRGGGRMGNRGMNNRANNIAHGMAAQMQGMPGVPGMNMNDPNFMMGNGQPEIYALLQQQNQMMQALSQQLEETRRQSSQGTGRGRGGRSLFDRTERGRGGFRRGNHGNGHNPRQNDSTNENGEAEDIDMGGERQAPNPESTVCKYNLACTNKDCKFAHQSPAAPPGATIDVNDVCTFGAACKNFKCVGRHPSPATKRAHQSEQECKFWPNCANARCPFRHPDMPPCRNGADCKTEGCKFTHVQTQCRFNPCTNRYCAYKHEDGQRGTFQDKVWTADGANNHVSERQFVNSDAEELVVPGSENGGMDESIA